MKLKKNLRTILGVIILVLAVIAALNGKNIFAGNNIETTQSDNFGEIADTTQPESTTEPTTTGPRIVEDGEYTTKEDVAEYLYMYKHLPSNFITKDEAKALGWVSYEGNLWEVAPGKSIGGIDFTIMKKNCRKKAVASIMSATLILKAADEMQSV